MAAKQKSLNPLRRRSARISGLPLAVEQDTGATVAEEDAIEEDEVVAEGEDPAGNQLIRDMNSAAGKSPSKRGRPRGSGQGRKRRASGADDNPVPATPTPVVVVSSTVADPGAQRLSKASTGKLKKAPPKDNHAARLLQRDIFQLPGDEGGPSLQPKKVRKLNQLKDANPSPFRKHGEIDVSTAQGVDLGDTALAPRAEKAKKSKRSRQRAISDADPESESEEGREQEAGLATAAPGPPTRTVRNDAISTFYGTAREGQADQDDAPQEETEADAHAQDEQEDLDTLEQKDREQEERLRQKCCEGVESLIQLFGCGDPWGKLLVAAHMHRKIVREFVHDHAEGRPTKRYNPQTEVGKAATEALDKLSKLYEEEKVDWAAEAAAATAACLATRQIKDNESPSKRGLDLYLSVLPRYVPILKAVLRRIQPKPTSTRAHLGPLIRMLKYTSEALERARAWQPRPRAFEGYNLLALVRDDYTPCIKRIREGYSKQLAVLAADEEAQRARLKERERIAHQEEQDRLWLQTREDRIQTTRNAAANTLQNMKMQQRLKEEQRLEAGAKLRAEQKEKDRRPLNEITRRVVGPVHDIDDFEEDGTRHIYQDPEEAVTTQSRAWSQAELAALWQALMKQYPKENRFAMIHQRHGKEMPGRTVDDIRREAVAQKRGCMDLVASLAPAEAAKWNFLMSVPG